MLFTHHLQPPGGLPSDTPIRGWQFLEIEQDFGISYLDIIHTSHREIREQSTVWIIGTMESVSLLKDMAANVLGLDILRLVAHPTLHGQVWMPQCFQNTTALFMQYGDRPNIWFQGRWDAGSKI